MSGVCSSLYWSDLGAVPKIERSRLDGTGREIFVSKDLDKPLGLSVDYAARRLYWVDDFRDTIESVDLLTAENRRVIRVYSSLARAGPQLFALTVFDVSWSQNVAVLPPPRRLCFCVGSSVRLMVGWLVGLSVGTITQQVFDKFS